MANELPNVKPQGKYSVKATCQALGITRSTLLKYSKLGRIKGRASTYNGRTAYLGCDIISFWKKM